MESRDCLSMLLLHEGGQPAAMHRVVSFAETLCADMPNLLGDDDKPADVYELDEYWMLIYELQKQNKLSKGYHEREKTFGILMDADVSFFQTKVDIEVPRYTGSGRGRGPYSEFD